MDALWEDAVQKHRDQLAGADMSHIYFKAVKVKRSYNGKRSIVTCEDPKEFYQTDPMSPDMEALLAGREHCYIVIAIDISTGFAHFGPELGGISF